MLFFQIYALYVAVFAVIIIIGWLLWLHGTVDGKLYDDFRDLQLAMSVPLAGLSIVALWLRRKSW